MGGLGGMAGLALLGLMRAHHARIAGDQTDGDSV